MVGVGKPRTAYNPMTYHLNTKVVVWFPKVETSDQSKPGFGEGKHSEPSIVPSSGWGSYLPEREKEVSILETSSAPGFD